MEKIEARCCMCRSDNFTDNSYTYRVPREQTKHGGGTSHGCETLVCPQCSGSCDLDGCVYEEPCENCETETLHNRCGSSVPTVSR
jgi:hypothetical protein